MSEEEPKGFIIRDRRGRSEEGQPAAGTTSSGRSTTQAGGSRPETASRETGPGAPSREVLFPVTFSSFVFSLGTSALMFMGEQLDPQQEALPVNLGQAKEIIDILSMLEEKTRGNLNPDEQKVLTDMLYALRLKYVDLASGKPTTQGS